MKKYEISYWRFPEDDGSGHMIRSEIREFASREEANSYARRAAGPYAWCTMQLGIEVF